MLRRREVLNEFLVAAGLAWWYRQYAPGDRNLAELEETARREKVINGLMRSGN